MKFRHHKIAVPQLTLVNHILEATIRQIQDAINQQPVQAPTEEARAIDLLRQDVLGEPMSLSPNNVQRICTTQCEVEKDGWQHTVLTQQLRTGAKEP